MNGSYDDNEINNNKYYYNNNHYQNNNNQKNNNNDRNNNVKKFTDDDALHYNNILELRKDRDIIINNSSLKIQKKLNENSQYRERKKNENIDNDNKNEIESDNKVYYSTPAQQSQYARALAAVWTPKTGHVNWTLGFKTIPKRKKPIT